MSMKRNMRRAMDRLEIDDGIMPLIGKLWKHGYETLHSCQGGGGTHTPRAYVSVMRSSGDGWLDDNASSYGLEFQMPNDCCEREKEDPYCGCCGAGVQVRVYRGSLRIPNSFETGMNGRAD